MLLPPMVAGVEIGARLQDRFFLRMLPPSFVATNPLAMLLDAAYRFDYADRTVGHWPVDLRCMPQLQFLWVSRSFLRQDPPCFRQQLGLVVLEIDHPIQTQSFHRSDKRRL